MNIWTKLLIAFWGVSLTALAAGEEFADSYRRGFPEYAERVVDQIEGQLSECSLRFVDPYAPQLPRPRVPADDAIVNDDWDLLAYYDVQRWGWGTRHVYKNPNGSYEHAVRYSDEFLYFETPRSGIVAQANRVLTNGGYRYQFYCRSRLVSVEQFYDCVSDQFASWISGQLCRYGSFNSD